MRAAHQRLALVCRPGHGATPTTGPARARRRVEEGGRNVFGQIPPLHEDLDDVVAGLQTHLTLVLRSAGRLVGSVRGHLDGEEWFVGRLMVPPDLRGRGLGRWLLARIEEAAPPEATSYALVTGARSESNLRRYRRAGYRPARDQADPQIVRLVKPRR